MAMIDNFRLSWIFSILHSSDEMNLKFNEIISMQSNFKHIRSGRVCFSPSFYRTMDIKRFERGGRRNISVTMEATFQDFSCIRSVNDTVILMYRSAFLLTQNWMDEAQHN